MTLPGHYWTGRVLEVKMTIAGLRGKDVTARA
jgi:hypothetical protein